MTRTISPIERRHQVAVEQQERALEARDEAQRSGRTERDVLAHVGDLDVVPDPVAEHRLDQMCEMPDRQRDVDEALTRQLPDQDRESRGLRAASAASAAPTCTA